MLSIPNCNEFQITTTNSINFPLLILMETKQRSDLKLYNILALTIFCTWQKLPRSAIDCAIDKTYMGLAIRIMAWQAVDVKNKFQRRLDV